MVVICHSGLNLFMEVFVMITEKTMLKSSMQYSDDKKKRYVLSVEWDKDKKKACVIMLSYCHLAQAVT